MLMKIVGYDADEMSEIEARQAIKKLVKKERGMDPLVAGLVLRRTWGKRVLEIELWIEEARTAELCQFLADERMLQRKGSGGIPSMRLLHLETRRPGELTGNRTPTG